MLTRELAIADYNGGQVWPDRLTQKRHSQYLQLADSMLKIYRQGQGRMRGQLHRAVHQLFEDQLDCPTRRIDSMCKLLDERSKYDKDKRGNAAELRKKVFRLAAKKHPLVTTADQLFESDQAVVKQDVAKQLGIPWAKIERELFSDVIQFHRLVEFEDYDSAAALLARYNVAQSQAVLYDAVAMTIWARDDFKLILRYAKLARLMHTISRQPDGQYVIYLDGPVSVLKQTRRYGVAFAKFLPSILACKDWRLQAVIQHRRSNWQNLFRLSPADGLKPNTTATNQFDSKLEESFADKWGDEPREGWTLIREGEILHRDQKVFVPDFVFQHSDGRRVLLEIVGFWTPEYLAAKQQTLAVFHDQKILLAIADSIDWPTNQPEHAVIRYKTTLKISSILEFLSS